METRCRISAIRAKSRGCSRKAATIRARTWTGCWRRAARSRKRFTNSLKTIHQAGGVTCAESVIDIHDGDVASTTVQHPQEGREALEAGSIADAGGHGDHGHGDQAADHAGQRA